MSSARLLRVALLTSLVGSTAPCRAQQPPAAPPARPTTAARSPAAASSSDGTQRTWGFITTGAGAAFLGVATYSFLSARSADDGSVDEYRKTVVPKGENACDYAKAQGDALIVDRCDEHQKYETWFWISAPVGVILAGTGIFLLATSTPPRQDASISITPSLGPRAGRLALRYRF